MDELCDIVDQFDQKIAVESRKAIKDFTNTRYINIFIRNKDGMFWVPYRRDDLKRWPSSPDFAVGGAVEAGEEYIEAAIRETKEEIGLDVKVEDLTQLAYVSPYKYPVACFSKVYEYICEEVPFTAAEYKSAQWMKLSDLLVLLSANEVSVKPDLLPLLRLCYGNLRTIDRTVFEP